MGSKIGLLLALLVALVLRAPATARSYSSHTRSYSSHSYRPHSTGATYVRGHFRKNGTYVRPHFRSHSDHNFSNNWSTKGNANPFTGKEGTKTTRQ